MSQAKDRGVLVTGGAGGIGRAITLGLLAAGYRVGVLDISAAALAELRDAAAERLPAAVSKLHTYATDITDYGAVEAAVGSFADAAGEIWGLVNNAGWDAACPFVDTDPSQWRKVVDINLYGPLNVTHLVVQRLVAAGRGRVVSIASDAGRVGSSGEAVYSAAKGGIIAFMKTLAREHARQGITFNSICPGPTDTPLLAGFDASGRLQEALQRAIPMRRLAQPDDFPALVAYFLSDQAGYVTGQVISVSGGLSMHG
ncbi:MAG: SDR family NAD(P)-dependent oxidoreductase [Pseudomonadales bacterium]